MKRLSIILNSLLGLFLVATGCQDNFATYSGTGLLSFDNFSITTDVSVSTKAASEEIGNYRIEILDAAGEVKAQMDYDSLKRMTRGVELEAGNYTFCAVSGDLPAATFDTLVYGKSVPFVITAKQTTNLDPVVCTLVQVGAKISYDDELLAIMESDGLATVEVKKGYPLEFKLKYNGGNIEYDQRTGYFALEDGSNSLVVTFTGKISGKNQKMTKTLSPVAAATVREIKFIKKVNDEGNATIALEVNPYVVDESLKVSGLADVEPKIGDDPKAPKGDGGIKLEFAPDCTMYTDLQNIVVPPLEEGTMDLRLVATVPGGIKKFYVKMDSTNENFMAAIEAAGGSLLDLINPAPEAEIIFLVVPFPHGPQLYGQTSVDFDLSAAQEPILGFKGEHSFTMQVTDLNSCHKDILVKLIVE